MIIKDNTNVVMHVALL